MTVQHEAHQWRQNLVCPCGARGRYPRPEKYRGLVCCNCGRPESDTWIATERIVSDSVWWNPATWNKWHWESIPHRHIHAKFPIELPPWMRVEQVGETQIRVVAFRSPTNEEQAAWQARGAEKQL